MSEPPAKYAKLSTAQKWAYHAHVYACRRVYLGVPDHVQTWDGDPKGEWFHERMAADETVRVQAAKAHKDAAHRPFTFTAEELQERAEWARIKGYANWDAYLDAIHAGNERIRGFLAWSAERRERRHPPRVGTFQRLGVIAKPAAE